MLLRILDVPVRPDRIAEWLRFTRDEGFPGCSASPAAAPSSACGSTAPRPTTG